MEIQPLGELCNLTCRGPMEHFAEFGRSLHRIQPAELAVALVPTVPDFFGEARPAALRSFVNHLAGRIVSAAAVFRDSDGVLSEGSCTLGVVLFRSSPCAFFRHLST